MKDLINREEVLKIVDSYFDEEGKCAECNHGLFMKIDILPSIDLDDYEDNMQALQDYKYWHKDQHNKIISLIAELEEARQLPTVYVNSKIREILDSIIRNLDDEIIKNTQNDTHHTNNIMFLNKGLEKVKQILLIKKENVDEQ